MVRSHKDMIRSKPLYNFFFFFFKLISGSIFIYVVGPTYPMVNFYFYFFKNKINKLLELYKNCKCIISIS
jgi:hypothetical protein